MKTSENGKTPEDKSNETMANQKNQKPLTGEQLNAQTHGQLSYTHYNTTNPNNNAVQKEKGSRYTDPTKHPRQQDHNKHENNNYRANTKTIHRKQDRRTRDQLTT